MGLGTPVVNVGSVKDACSLLIPRAPEGRERTCDAARSRVAATRSRAPEGQQESRGGLRRLDGRRASSRAREFPKEYPSAPSEIALGVRLHHLPYSRGYPPREVPALRQCGDANMPISAEHPRRSYVGIGAPPRECPRYWALRSRPPEVRCLKRATCPFSRSVAQEVARKMGHLAQSTASVMR